MTAFCVRCRAVYDLARTGRRAKLCPACRRARSLARSLERQDEHGSESQEVPDYAEFDGPGPEQVRAGERARVRGPGRMADPRRGRPAGGDPLTAAREYTADEVEFMTAMERYKRERRRPFPAWSEVLAVLRGLGYRKGRTS